MVYLPLLYFYFKLWWSSPIEALALLLCRRNPPGLLSPRNNGFNISLEDEEGWSELGIKCPITPPFRFGGLHLPYFRILSFFSFARTIRFNLAVNCCNLWATSSLNKWSRVADVVDDVVEENGWYDIDNGDILLLPPLPPIWFCSPYKWTRIRSLDNSLCNFNNSSLTSFWVHPPCFMVASSKEAIWINAFKRSLMNRMFLWMSSVDSSMGNTGALEEEVRTMDEPPPSTLLSGSIIGGNSESSLYLDEYVTFIVWISWFASACWERKEKRQC